MDDESLANLMAGVLRKDPALMKKLMQSDDVDWNQLGGQQQVEQTINKYAHHLLKLKDDAAKFNQDLHHNRRDGQATAADKVPATVASLQQEGKDKFVAKQFIEALFCYDAALLLMQDNKQQQQQQQQEAPSDQGQLLLSVLLNLSATHMKLQQPQHALVYAAAAVAFSCERSSKAYYRLAIALDQLHGTAAAAAAAGSNRASSLASAAIIMMKKAQRLLPPTATAQSKAEMMSQLQSEEAKKSAASGSSSSSNADEMNRALLVLVEHLANTIHHATAAAAADTMHSQQADSSSSDGAGVSAATLKDRGNSAFKKGNYMQALQHYTACFHTLQSSSSSSSSTAAVLLSNKAACCLQLGDQEALLHGAVDAAAAIVLCNAQVKAYYRAANALLQLGLLPQAAAVCDLGMLQSPKDDALQQLKKRIATGDGSSKKPSSSSSSKPSSSRTGASSSSSSSSSSHKKGLSERDFIALQRKDKAGADVMSMLNSLSQMAAAAGKDVSQIFDTRIPPFHEEYTKAGRCPSQVDSKAVYHKLWEGYEAARSQPSSLLGLQKHAAVFNIETMRLRLTGPNDKEGLEWLCTAPFGNVRFCERGPYRGGYQSFSNTTAKAEFLALDTTHVAIGFVGLGGLAASCKLLMEHHRLDAADREGWRLLTAAAGGPLRWVGYEMSAYAVAKSLVLLEMIEQDASVDSLLQAWYSSAWSNSTLDAFRAALTTVLHKEQQQPAAVLQILRHWQTHDVPLSKSRKLWLSSQALTLTFIANFKRRADRVALCEYITTGQLLPGAAAADVGNVMMFEVPGGHADRAYDESVLQTLHSIPLLEQVASGGSFGPDIMSVATNIIRDQISSLKGLIRAGAVTAEVRHGSVTPSSNTIISAIKSLQPYTITWSNVPDYFTPAEFHKLARAVSAEGNTVHYMHTMNWIRDVKGCSHVDFMLSMPEEILPKAMPQIRDASNQAASELYRSHDLGKLVLLPPVDTIRNIIDWSLCLKYCKDWVSAFFAPPLSGMKHVERQVQLVGPPEYSVLSHSNTTMFITFTYDEEINFTQMKRHEMVNM